MPPRRFLRRAFTQIFAQNIASNFARIGVLLGGLTWIFPCPVSSAPASPEPAQGPGPDRVLLIVNDNSPLSRNIGEYYGSRRHIPAKNYCHIQTEATETINRAQYEKLAAAVGGCLKKSGLVESVYYLVLAQGVPLRVSGNEEIQGDAASVDSELTLLYQDLKTGRPHATAGVIVNPFYGRRDEPFSHPKFPMYLVTRLAAYDLDGVKKIIDRALVAANRGKFVIDMRGPGDGQGNDWLRTASILLPDDRVILDESVKPVYNQTDVIAFASWGSNDDERTKRHTGFRWLPGAIVTEYVSTDGRTFERPSANWVPSGDWHNPLKQFAKSPQALVADYLEEGATGGSGHVYEPLLFYTPHPDLLLPAYYKGRNLAESFYLAIPALSWRNIVVGDPLCNLGKPK
jgi:uncharacterized protein (TIGR03790 family)